MVDGVVVVVGGGVSGLAAALRLSAAGRRVRLVDQAPRFGGRCYSYRDEATGDVVDNGQHVLVGAYRNTLAYLAAIGTRDRLVAYDEIPFFLPGRGVASLHIGALAPPLHLARALLGYRHLTPYDRLALARVALFLRGWDGTAGAWRSAPDVEGWLRALGQSPSARERLWNPLCVSVMNERPERASALLFARALRATFLGAADDARVLIPRVGQSELYVDPALSLLRQRGAILETGREVAAIDGTEVRFRDGERTTASAVVAAVPPHVLDRIAPGTVADPGVFGASPIVSVHLWFDRPVLDRPFLAMLGSRAQWLFDRRRILKQAGAHHAVSAVVSAASDIVGLDKEEIIATVRGEIAGLSGAARAASLLSSLVIKEKRATFSASPGAEALRPGTRTARAGLYLAGDWTATGLPATIEGAITSGIRAAEAVVADLRTRGG